MEKMVGREGSNNMSTSIGQVGSEVRQGVHHHMNVVFKVLSFSEVGDRTCRPMDLTVGADEWNVNKWDSEASLKVVSKGDECIIRLEDRTTGELYARAFLRNGKPHPGEPVIDSSRYFVLQVEENIGAEKVMIGLQTQITQMREFMFATLPPEIREKF